MRFTGLSLLASVACKVLLSCAAAVDALPMWSQGADRAVVIVLNYMIGVAGHPWWRLASFPVAVWGRHNSRIAAV
jgi:hypothetical protein